MSKKNILLADAALLVVAAGWGLNFSIMKGALDDITPLYYMGIRFVISAILMWVIFFKKMKAIEKKDWKAGIIVGLFLFASFSTQIIGLQFTTPGKSGFISNASVIIVPFVFWWLYKKSPGLPAIFGSITAMAGLGILSLTTSFTIELGDGLMFLSALLFSGQIIATGLFAKDTDPIVLSTLQITVTGICCMIGAVFTEPVPALDFSLNVIGAIAYGAAVCTMLAFALQSAAQRVTPASHAAIILCLESVFALLFSLMLGYEILTTRGIVGSIVVFTGFVISQMEFKRKAA
jgi:drug/metabolite transporter (DMT)-like permease